LGGDRVELYTDPLPARSNKARTRPPFVRPIRQAAELAASLGMGINAGTTWNLDNLRLFRQVPHLDEVSNRSRPYVPGAFVGLPTVVRSTLAVLSDSLLMIACCHEI